ncbi:hypothetical protein GCM10027398_13410 [Azotobacter salinestris]
MRQLPHLEIIDRIDSGQIALCRVRPSGKVKKGRKAVFEHLLEAACDDERLCRVFGNFEKRPG